MKQKKEIVIKINQPILSIIMLMYIKITIRLTIQLFYSLTSMYKVCISYLIHVQTATAIWSGNFLVFSYILGRQLVRHSQKDNLVLFCFVLVL